MQTTTSEHSNKLFVGGISPFTNIGNPASFSALTYLSIETMKKHFGQFGELVDCVIMQDKNTGKFRGFGFVTFRNPEVINDVLLETHVIDGKTVFTNSLIGTHSANTYRSTAKKPCLETISSRQSLRRKLN